MAKQSGVVSKFNDKRGFGFITPDKGGTEVFVHWEGIETDDRWPKLEKGMKVQYRTEVGDDGKTRAVGVSKPGGGKLSVSTDNKEYGDFRYPGKVKWFRSRSGKEGGFGFIELTMDAAVGSDTLPEGTEVYVSREEILSENPVNPKVAKGMEVEFLVAKTADGKFLACEVTLPNGVPISDGDLPEKTDRPKKGAVKGKGKGAKGKGKGKGAPSGKSVQKAITKLPAPPKPVLKAKGKGGAAGPAVKKGAVKGKGKGKGKGKVRK